MTAPQDPFATPPGGSESSRGSAPLGGGPSPRHEPPVWHPEAERHPEAEQQPGGVGQGAPYGTPGFGTPPGGWGAPAPAKQGTSGLAIASLVAAFLVPIVGLILAFVAKSQIKKTGQGGNGLATAAIVVSVAFMLIGLLLVSSGGGVPA